MRTTILAIALFVSIKTLGQDTTWHEVQLDSIASFQVNCKMVAKRTTENDEFFGFDSKQRRFYAIGCSKNYYRVTSSSGLDSFYKKSAEGDIILGLVNENHFSYTINDTTLFSVKGKHFHLTSTGQSTGMPFILIEYYVFLMNGHIYSFTICYRNIAPEDNKELALFLSSLKFKTEAITESKFR